MLEFLFNKAPGLQLYWSEAPTQVFYCKICEIFQNSYFEEHLLTIASVRSSFDQASLYTDSSWEVCSYFDGLVEAYDKKQLQVEKCR